MRLALVLLVAVLVSGCGGPPISAEASAALDALVEATWDAAEAGDVDAARGRLDDLRGRAQDLHEAGELDEARLAEVLAAADAVDEQLGTIEEAEPEPQEPVDDDPADDDGEDDGDRDEEARKEAEEQREDEERAREKAEEDEEKAKKAAEKAAEKAREKDEDDD